LPAFFVSRSRAEKVHGRDLRESGVGALPFFAPRICAFDHRIVRDRAARYGDRNAHREKLEKQLRAFENAAVAIANT